MTDWADVAAPIHFPGPVEADDLRRWPEVYGLARWFYDQNATELSNGTIVALGWHDCLIVARLIHEADEPWADHPAAQFAELLTRKLEELLGAAPNTGTNVPTEGETK